MTAIDDTSAEYSEELEQEEQEVLSQDDSSEQPPTDIVAFNELRSCADLVRMYKSNQLTIKPEFQRDVVWSTAAQTRFIDSLTKQLPIPSMCISLDYNTNKRLVIDGLQRMWSIIMFLTNDDWKLSNLRDIDDRLAGKKVSYIREHNPAIHDAIENWTIPVTVLRCDYKKKNHMEYLFTIFHRLNTGGNKLTNQEIRNCIYSGDLNALLGRCVQNNEFRDLFDLKKDETYRFAYEEFVLRFFAFSDRYKQYDGNLSRFLNTYMTTNRNPLDDDTLSAMESHFDETTHLIFEKVCDGKQLPKLSKATYEALFVGVGENMEALRTKPAKELCDKFKAMRQAEEFSLISLKNAITTKAKLIARLDKAIEIFSK